MHVRIDNDDERPTKPYVVDFSKVIDPREEAEEYKLKAAYHRRRNIAGHLGTAGFPSEQ